MATEPQGMRSGTATSWSWPIPPRANRYAVTITEIMDTASDGRRVAVVDGAVWPPVGTDISVIEDETHVRRGTVAKVEFVLGSDRPARVVIWAALERDPA